MVHCSFHAMVLLLDVVQNIACRITLISFNSPFLISTCQFSNVVSGIYVLGVSFFKGGAGNRETDLVTVYCWHRVFVVYDSRYKGRVRGLQYVHFIIIGIYFKFFICS